MNLTLSGITKKFGSHTAVDQVSLSINSGELFFLLGPSGCGKTTLLRIIAGFLTPESGEIRFSNRPMNRIPPHKRNTALVFQNYALWPHLSVFENVAYGLRIRKLNKAEIKKRVQNALKSVQMEEFSDRKPASLSGGQQQRVALARALVVDPDLLLFDEPLSNLDARLRHEMRAEIKRLHAENRITAIYVTHDQQEALSLADRIAIMRNGRIEQIGSPIEIYTKPANRFVASFIGEINLPNPGSLIEKYLAMEGSPFGFRPEHVQISETGIPATVRFSSYLGSRNELILETSTGELVKAETSGFLPPGSKIHFSIDRKHLLRFTENSGSE